MASMKKKKLIATLAPTTVEAAIEVAADRGSVALERAEVKTLPCPRCDEQLTPLNRSILADGRVVHIGCKEADKVLKARKLGPGDMVPMVDHAGRTVLKLEERGVTTAYLNTGDLEGMAVRYEPTAWFRQVYKLVENYPLKKAVQHFIKCAVDYGATQDVLDWLGRVVSIKKEDAMAATKKVEAKKAGGKGAPKGGGSGRKPGSGARIRELILKGWDNEKILATIHKEFPGSKAKASDVSWNKGKLRRDGVKIPE
jgi:hypothetical protein